MRIAVIGARSRNQGIGAHLARFCVQAGADVCAVLGTTPETAAEAACTLAETTQHDATPHTDLDALLAEHAPEALVIASPHETHAEYLERALAARLHVLCEKPLVWGAADTAGAAETLAHAFREAGLHLRVNAQWPETLPTYRRLFPVVSLEAPRCFAMRMSPRSKGLRMIPAAVPHVLSLLQAVLPDPGARVEDIEIGFEETEPERIRLSFRYRAGAAAVECAVELVRCLTQPRPAAYGFDGHVAHRRVELDGYEMFFEDPQEGRRIPLPDPTPMLVRSFLEQVAAGPPEALDPAAVPGMRLLMQIDEAARNQPSSPIP